MLTKQEAMHMKKVNEKIEKLWYGINFDGLRCAFKANCGVKEIKAAVERERELAANNGGKE